MTASHRQLRVPWLLRALQMLGIWVALGLLVGIGVFVSPKFLTAGNLLNVLRNVTLLGIVSIGVAFITYGRNYVDISIPAIMATSGMVAVSAQPLGIGMSLACGLATGLLIGFINGWVIGYLRLNPIIWTLAMSCLLDGLLRWGYSGHQIYPDPAMPAGRFFLALSQSELPGGFPMPTLLMLVLAFVGHAVMKHTKFGSQVQLTGAAYEVARLSGVPVRAIVLFTFVASAFTTTLAGLLLTSMNKQATFDTGLGYDFNAVTAVVLGGVALQGGRGSIAGVLGGVIVIGVLLNLMSLMGLSSFVQLVVKGVVFIGVVGLTAWFSRRSGRNDA